MQGDERGLDLFARLALRDAPGEARLLVVVDQFEEVFTYRPQDEQAKARFEKARAAFFANLLHAAAASGGRVAVVLTMRSDFLGACASFPRLNDVLNAHLVQVGPMQEDELREAINRPAYLVGCEVEPALSERLLADVEGQPGALPLLQFALTEVWKKRDVRRLTLRAYEALGGVEGALEHRANEIFQRFKPEEQEFCRRIFLRLVQPGEGTEDTKRRVPYRELLPDDPERAAAMREVIRVLAHRDARLITTEGADATDGAVEVAHEALIRGWTQLRRWIETERAGLRIQRRLTEAAQEWADARPEAKEDFLYSGARLAVCREWVATHRDELNPIESAFLAASEEAERQRKQDEVENERRLREAAEAAQEAERKRAEDAEAAAKRQKRLGRRFLVAAVGAVVFAAISGGLAVWANREASKAILGRANTLIANAHSICISRQPGQRFDALKALGEAVKIGRELRQSPQWFDWPRCEAVAALALPDVHITQSWPGFPPGTLRAEVSTDFTLYARTTETGSVSVRRVADDVEVASLPPLGEHARPGFGPGGLLMRYGEESGRFQLWDLTRANPVLRFPVGKDKDPGPVNSWSWDSRPDGRLVLLTYRNSSSLGMYETGTGNFRRLVASGIMKGADRALLHPSEEVAAITSYGSSTLQVLDLRTGAVLSVHLPWRGSGTGAWSPDGLTLVVPDGDSSLMHVYAFDLAARALRFTRKIQGPYSTGGGVVRFNPAGDCFAVRGWDAIVHLYDAVTGRLLFSTLPLRFSDSTLRFDPSGRRLAAARVGDLEDQIGVWSVADARGEYRVLPRDSAGHNPDLGLPAIHPQGASRPSPPSTVLFYTTWRPAESSNPFPLSAGPLPVSTAPATC